MFIERSSIMRAEKYKTKQKGMTTITNPRGAGLENTLSRRQYVDSLRHHHLLA